MAGSRHGWRSIPAGLLFLTGCVGLGNMPADTLGAKKPRPLVEPFTPEMRIADNAAVAQAKNDIPLVPIPPPPLPRPSRRPLPNDRGTDSKTARRAVAANEQTPQQSPESRSSDGRQADGSTQPHTVRQIVQQATARCSTLDSYIVRLVRRESSKGKPGPEEIIAFSFRKKPFSVHLKWLGKTAQGREVVYVKDRFGNKIHTKVAAGDSMLMPAGSHLALSPDNILVRSASRHPITDAGVCRCVEMLAAFLEAQERGDRRQGTLTLLGPQKRPEFSKPVETLERLIPPGIEPELPRGGRRLLFFDPDSHLPMLVITYDEKGNEVEYYHYDRLITPANLDDDDFNPDKLWPKQPAPRPQRKQG